MNNNNWLKSIAKTYIQLNENNDNPVSQRNRENPNANDMRGPGDVGGLRGVERQMEREGMISQGVIHPEVIANHGSPFNEDGSINPDHISVRHRLETLQRRVKTDNPLAHIRITPRVVDGRQLGYFISVMGKPQSPPQPPLNEARKVKPTATDRKENDEIERAARLAHQHAANAITGTTGFKTYGKYSGMNSAEDPDHDNVMAHLADVAPAVTDAKTAILLVAKQHGVDPKAAIAKLSSSAPMSPQDFMRAMRR